MLHIVASYHCMQFHGKLIPNLNKCKKPSFRPNFGPFGPNSGRQFFFFFFLNMAPSVSRYHGQLSSCTIPEKTNHPILTKLSDGLTDGRTDGRG